MLKSHRICLRPTPEQEMLFLQHAGYARFAYDWAVGEFKAGLEVGEWLSERTLRPRWNKVKRIIAPWASTLSQNPAKYAIVDFGQGAFCLGSLAQGCEGRKESRPPPWIPTVQAPEARAGFPSRQRTGHRASGRQGRDSAEDRPGGHGRGAALRRLDPRGHHQPDCRHLVRQLLP